MNTKKMQIAFKTATIEYTLTFKHIKNVNMRIKNDGLHVSAPFGTSIHYIEQILLSRQEALIGYIEKLSSPAGSEPFADGKELLYLGNSYTLIITIGTKNKVTVYESSIIVCAKHGKAAETVYENWLKENAKEVFNSSLMRVYPLLSTDIKALPTLHVKKLTASWGRCTPVNNNISLSLWLMKADESLIDYVMLHELCHYIHLNHSKAFYALLKSLMPDYLQRKKQLNTIKTCL